ncbi:MAG: helix-hairpin-helix domain-containing protein [Eubacteriales bacterium]|nr:helix-hairpin-helix domain-containing protein [Eubacteriales bacterium]
MGELRKIPGVGKEIEKDLIELGINSIDDLKGRDPQELYDRECMMKGVKIDRCQLYVYRLAVYFAENSEHEAEKLKWWYWKDKEYPYANNGK